MRPAKPERKDDKMTMGIQEAAAENQQGGVIGAFATRAQGGLVSASPRKRGTSPHPEGLATPA